MRASCHVYVDRKPDGTPFYVGIGSSKRVAYEPRNAWHTNICAKHIGWYREIIETASRDLCKEFEALLVSEIGRRDLGLGPLVNQTDGGDGRNGGNVTQDVRERISAKLSGVAKSEAMRKKLSTARKGSFGIKPSEATRQKMSESQKRASAGKDWSSISAKISAKLSGRKGAPQSAETVEKRRAKLIGQKRSPEARKRISEGIRAATLRRKNNA